MSQAGAISSFPGPVTNEFPITPYVVGPVGQAGYQTIQSALDAANAAGGGIVYVQPGTYTENLTLYGNTEVVGTPGNSDAGTSGNTTIIIGVHTPPETNSFTFANLNLQSATHIFSSAVAGSASLIIENCFVNVTNGYIFNLASWTGTFITYNVGDGSTNNGVVNNTGGSTCFFISATHGAGTGQTMITSGPVIMQEIDLNCPWNAQTGTTIACDYVIFSKTITCSNNSTGSFNWCRFTTGATAALTMSSSGSISLSDCVINSSNNPSIAGAGAGTLTLANVTYLNDSSVATTLTLATSDVTSSSLFRTTPLTSNLNISGTTIAATGSDPDINISLTPKGVGFVSNAYSSPSGTVVYRANNTDNTSGTSNAGFVSSVGGTSSGDAYHQYIVTGATTWTTGIDNSASDAYVIAASATLGTTNAASWTTAGVMTNTGNINRTSSSVGATNSINCTNSDNTNTLSHAILRAISGGSSGGNPYTSYTISGVVEWISGIDNASADRYKISRSGAFGTNDFVSISMQGEINYPSQPCFLAYLGTTQTDVTGDTTTFTIVANVEVFDQNSDYNNATGTFTAPVSGKYFLQQSTYVFGGTDITAAISQMVTSNRTYRQDGALLANATGSSVIGFSTLADMDSGDTATIAINCTDTGGKVDDIQGGAAPFTWFSGQLMC